MTITHNSKIITMFSDLFLSKNFTQCEPVRIYDNVDRCISK
jgi:hypothetical protein